jgi:hypothetical protein
VGSFDLTRQMNAVLYNAVACPCRKLSVEYEVYGEWPDWFPSENSAGMIWPCNLHAALYIVSRAA